jgi:hypothetical protein
LWSVPLYKNYGRGVLMVTFVFFMETCRSHQVILVSDVPDNADVVYLMWHANFIYHG